MNSAQPNATVADRDFLYHVFHLLSQPMTALQCSLELALIGSAGPEELRTSIECALENAERLRKRLLLVRELADASDAGDTSQPVQLEDILAEVLEQLQPLLESAGLAPAVSLCPVLVVGERSRLSRAFLYLFESLLVAGAAAAVLVQTSGNLAIVRVTGARHEALNGERTRVCPEIEIARRTFQTVGGNLLIAETPDGTWSCEVVLPAVRSKSEAGAGSGDTIVTPAHSS